MIGEDGKLYIDGDWAKSSGDDWIEAVSPATEEVIGRDLVEAYGGMVVIAPLVEGVSTTRILQSAVA